MSDSGDKPEERRRAESIYEARLEQLKDPDAEMIASIIDQNDKYHMYFHHMDEEENTL